MSPAAESVERSLGGNVFLRSRPHAGEYVSFGEARYARPPAPRPIRDRGRARRRLLPHPQPARHDLLMANVFAQTEALASGKTAVGSHPVIANEPSIRPLRGLLGAIGK